MIEWVVGFVCYGALVVLHTGLFLAYCQHMSRGKARRDEYRWDLSISVGLALIPLAWAICPFVTGFYQHGWQLRPEKQVGQ